MQNQVFGIITISICTLIYYFAWKKHHKKAHYKFALFLLIIAGVILRLYVVTDFYLHEWDERYHALVAKNLMQHPLLPTLYDNPILNFDYKQWGSNHVWLHKQPLSLWFIAISLKVFGINEIAVRIPSILFSSAAIFLTYQISCFLFKDKSIAFIAAFLHSIHGLSIEMVGGRAATEHIDTLFQFLIELGVYFAILSVIKGGRRFTLLTGVAVGLAILTKWLPAGIVILLWLLLQLRNKESNFFKLGINLFLLTTISVFIFSPWQFYIFHTFPLEAQWESAYNTRHLFEALEGHGKPFFYHFNMLRINYGELVYLPLLWFLYYTFKLKDRKLVLNALVLITWILIPYIFFSIAETKMQGYTLFTAPAVFIITSFFIIYLTKTTKRKYLRNLIITLLLILPIRYSIERIKPFDLKTRQPEWVIKIKDLSKKVELKANEKILLLNVPHPIETMFYCKKGVTAYSHTPTKEELVKAKENGYIIFELEEKETRFELKLVDIKD